MKTTIYILLTSALSLAMPAQADDFVAVRNLTQAKLENFAASVESSANIWPRDAFLQIDRFRYPSRLAADEEILDGAIWQARANAETPKEIRIEALTTSLRDRKEAVAAGLTHADYQQANRVIPDLAKQLGQAMKNSNSARLYTAQDIADLTFCQSMAVIDHDAGEILLISSCWVD